MFCRGQAVGKINPFWPRSDLDKMVIAELSVASARDILYFLTFSPCYKIKESPVRVSKGLIPILCVCVCHYRSVSHRGRKSRASCTWSAVPGIDPGVEEERRCEWRSKLICK